MSIILSLNVHYTIIMSLNTFVFSFDYSLTRSRRISNNLVTLNFYELIHWSVKQHHYELISKFNVGLKSLLHQGISEPEFYGDLVYKLKD